MYRLWVWVLTACSGGLPTLLWQLSGPWSAPTFGKISVAVMLSGWALGSVVGGQAAAARPSIQKLAALLLLGIWTAAPAGLVAEPVVGLISKYVAAPLLVTIACALVLVFVPTVLAASLPPYAVGLLAAQAEDSGRCAGIVWGGASIGAVFGLLLPAGEPRVYWTALGTAALLAVAILATGRRLSRRYAT